MTETSTAIVTGGASGIGAAIVRGLNEDGFFTCSLDLSESEDAGMSVVGDVCDPQVNARAVDRIVAETGRLDAVIANAGIHDGGIGLDATGEELRDCFRRVLEVDLIGYALAAHAARPHLVQARGTLILTLSDASFLVGQQGAGMVYTAAKHAAVGLLGWLARDLAPDVRVNAVAPGGVVTDLKAVTSGDDRRVFKDIGAKSDSIRNSNPLGTLLSADEVADYYRWLVSDRCGGLTGQIIRPDGGLAVR